MNILVYASDPVLPEFLRKPLEPHGHVVAVAEDIEDLQASSPDADALVIPRRPHDVALDQALKIARSASVPAVVLGLDESERDAALKAGATAFLTLPFTDVQVLEALGASVREQKLILLADDSPMIHKHTVPILEEAGYEVASAMDGAEGLRMLRERRPDLLMTDVEMPKLDGYELCQAVKSDPDTAHIPVLISSTLGESRDLERGFDAGADDYLVKPVIPEELLTRVKQLLAETMPASRERVLVVDDSPAQRHFVADCLSRQGFHIETAQNGREAFDKAREFSPHLIVSDYEMPEMTGFELVHALKRVPEMRNIPVIMLTARDSKRDMAQMRAAGASAYLVKPFAQDKCIATVERTLAERRLLDYKLASSVYISRGAQRAAEERAAMGDLGSIRAEEREMSVLFSDICGFTRMSGNMKPREVIELLNDYFDLLCPVIVDLHGDIDKFIGDAIMAVFDVGRGWAPPPERAVRAALSMQEKMAEFNATHTIQIQMRIGVNTGPLVRGDLGSRYVRRDYTVIGDTVNRANRYESAAPKGGVLVSQSTLDAIRPLVTFEQMPGLSLKGVAEPVNAYHITSIAPPEDSNE